MAIFNSLCLTTSTLKPHYPILRCMRIVSENTVHGGTEAHTPNQKVYDLKMRHSSIKKKEKDSNDKRITVVTAYDYPSAVHVDRAGIDVCLVGDSASMVVHGHDTTLHISVDEMLVHCRAVARGAKRPLLVGELPFGTYESSNNQAVETAVRVLKEGGMDAIKLGGRSPSGITAANAIVSAGFPVMGHVGLSPQDISVLEEVRPQRNKSEGAVEVVLEVVKSATALEKAGCFSVVLDCVPPPVAALVTYALNIPTIGIRAGPSCSGQLLVYHDLLRMSYLKRTDPDDELSVSQVKPESCKPYTLVEDVINKALLEYKKLVKDPKFLELGNSPYKISEREFNCLTNKFQRSDLLDVATNVSQMIDEGKIPCYWWNPSN